MLKIAIINNSDQSASNEAFLLSEQLNLALLASDEQAVEAGMDYVLFYQQGLSLKRLRDSLTLKVNFNDGRIQYRSQRFDQDGELLLTAVSARAGLKVLDATAGLGRDAFLMAAAACQLTICERNPVIHQILKDGLLRLDDNSVAGDFKLLNIDSLSYLDQLLEGSSTQQQRPDVIYLDPMFPQRKKSAAVKREMQILQDIVGFDTDIESLIEKAMLAASHRVVIKRPIKAPPLLGFPTTMQVKGKSTRFDIWVKKRLS